MENEGKEEGSACVSRAVVGVPPSTSSPDTQTEYCREKAQEIAKWGLVFLYYNSAKSCFVNKIFAAKERKEHIDKNLCCLFFAIFAIFCGKSSLVAASAALGLWRFLAAIVSIDQVRQS